MAEARAASDAYRNRERTPRPVRDINPAGRPRKTSKWPMWVVVVVVVAVAIRGVFLLSKLRPSYLKERVEAERRKNAPGRPIQGPQGIMYPVKQPTAADAADAEPAAGESPSPEELLALAMAAESVAADSTPSPPLSAQEESFLQQHRTALLSEFEAVDVDAEVTVANLLS